VAANTITPVYFISGLGVDERAFIRIRLPEGFEMRFMRWIDPLKDESLADYARRLFKDVDTSQPIIVAGMSFGGITACELSKFVRIKKLILFSSIARSAELPKIYRLMGAFGMHRYIPTAWIKYTGWHLYWLFGTKKSDEKTMLKAIMADIPDNFLRWATRQVLLWKNKHPPENLFRIHGTHDRVLYFPKTKVDCVVRDAGHFMVYTHAEEVNRGLEEAFGK
jgi:pimeloyl-ACP methyl ester carboxylesterase